jgi:putative Holliday junction resolvase
VIFIRLLPTSLYACREDRTGAIEVKGKAPVIASIEELPGLLAAGGTLAGIDLGDKTIGVAVSDRSLAFAHPRPVIMRKKFSIDAAALLDMLGKDDVRAVAVGLPLNMDGSEGPRAQATRAFVRNIGKLTELPFMFWDERLSTVAAERALLEMDVSRGKRAGRIDSAAAAFILQGVLDRLQALGSSDATSSSAFGPT